MTTTTLLIIVLIILLLGGGWGWRSYPERGPYIGGVVGLLILVLVILWATGRIG